MINNYNYKLIFTYFFIHIRLSAAAVLSRHLLGQLSLLLQQQHSNWGNLDRKLEHQQLFPLSVKFPSSFCTRQMQC